jgi:hypothetical protein
MVNIPISPSLERAMCCPMLAASLGHGSFDSNVPHCDRLEDFSSLLDSLFITVGSLVEE